MTNVTIPNSVTNIGAWTFASCTSLTMITVDPSNCFYTSSMDGIVFDKSMATLIMYPAGKGGTYTVPNGVTSIGKTAFSSCASLTSITIPDSVTNIGGDAFRQCTSLTKLSIGNSVISIGNGAFAWCTSLTSVTIPNSVFNIGGYAFANCTRLASMFFKGNAPSVGWAAFADATNTTVYYLPGTTGWGSTGWGSTFGGRPTAPWHLPNPLILNFGSSFGVHSNRFGFTISWASSMTVVVEAATNLANPTWIPIATNTLTEGATYFSDPDWANHPNRFYRLRTP